MSVPSRSLESKEYNRDKIDNVPKIDRHLEKKKHHHIILSLAANRIAKIKVKIPLILKPPHHPNPHLQNSPTLINHQQTSTINKPSSR